MYRCLKIMLLMFAMALPACRLVRIKQVQLPSGVFAPEGTAVAYHIDGKAGSTLNDVRLPLAPLTKKSIDDSGGYLLFTHSNGRFRAIQHRQSGDALYAELLAKRTYIVTPLPFGHLGLSLNTFCRFTERPRTRREIPKICQQIFCTQEVFAENLLREKFGAPNDIIEMTQGILGGWILPGPVCELCTKPAVTQLQQSTPPTFECFSLSDRCTQGTPLLQADFETDAVGLSPSSSPAGTPPDDRLIVSGDVVVVALPSSGENAVQLTRTSQVITTTQLDAIMGAGARASGSYCVKFTVTTTDIQDASARISFVSTTDKEAFRLLIGKDEARLVSGNPTSFLPGDFSANNLHTFRFDIDLDLHRFDVILNGSVIQSGLSFINPDFDSPMGLRFRYFECMLECFEGRILVDDLAIYKTN